MNDDGVATIYFRTRDTDEKTVKQVADILNFIGTDLINIILLDGEKEYYYTDDMIFGR